MGNVIPINAAWVKTHLSALPEEDRRWAEADYCVVQSGLHVNRHAVHRSLLVRNREVPCCSRCGRQGTKAVRMCKTFVGPVFATHHMRVALVLEQHLFMRMLLLITRGILFEVCTSAGRSIIPRSTSTCMACCLFYKGCGKII